MKLGDVVWVVVNRDGDRYFFDTEEQAVGFIGSMECYTITKCRLLPLSDSEAKKEARDA